MLIYDVFGRHIGVQRQGERWLLFRVDLNERKCSPLRGIIIPDDLPEYAAKAVMIGKLRDLLQPKACAVHVATE